MTEHCYSLLMDDDDVFKKKLMESFDLDGCFEIEGINFMPSKAAKRLSPLDNGIFHKWKERVCHYHSLTKNNIVRS
jgi:hypothetical protein